MGRLTYDSTTEVSIDDRALAHLQIVIGAKLQRGEAFHFSWKDVDHPVEMQALWLAPDIPLHFKYFGSRPAAINKAWIAALAATSNSGGGLHLVPEPTEPGSDSGTGDRE